MAGTVISTLYPPLIDTFMPAFLQEGPAKVSFSISSYNERTPITKLHISLVDQETNLNALAQNNDAAEGSPNTLLNGIWIINFTQANDYLSYDELHKIWTLEIPASILRKTINNEKKFGATGYYKLQLRLDDSSESVSGSYLTDQRPHFSEWSSVCLLKAIPTPSILLTNFDRTTDGDPVDQDPSFNAGIIPISGQVIFGPPSYGETVRSYSIEIYDTNDPDDVLDSIGPVFTGDAADPNDIYWLSDCENAVPGVNYTVEIKITTKNQYHTTKKYHFSIYNYDSMEFTPIWTFKDYSFAEENTHQPYNTKDGYKIITEEDGNVRFNITITETMPPGYLYVKRASNLDNYKKWELISCTEENGIVSRDFEDMTVGSLVKYLYSVQFQTKRGLWTKSHKISDSDALTNAKYIYPDFYTMFLYRDGKQLAIRYDGQVTSLRSVVNRQKIDTLGGKYPKFAENAQMNYKQFSISGLIDAESDFNRFFLNEKEYSDQMEVYNTEMNGKYEIRNDTIADGVFTYKNSRDAEIKRTIAHTLHDIYPKNNWWLEREFREKALQWLNDGEPKLFRSMPEGNMAVMLTDISLSPNHTLGRRIYSFTATMYEIEDGYSLETLNSLGIINVVNEKELETGGEGGGGGEENPDDDESQNYTTHSLVGQFCSSSFPRGAGNYSSVILGSMLRDTSSTEGFDPEYVSIQDYLENIVYAERSALGKRFKIVPGSIKLKDLKINFESNPKWYSFAPKTSSNDPITLISSESNSKGDIHLGYKLALRWEEANTDSNQNLTYIFVNERGYYQVPTDLNVYSLRLYDGVVASLNYKIEYKTMYNDSAIPSRTELERKIVGQVSGVWRPNVSVGTQIKEKHRWLHYKDGFLTMEEHLVNWHALSLELTPYSVVAIQYDDNDDSYYDYVVGRTGIYNLVDNYPINDLKILGKRMVKASDDRQPYLDDWEYVLDDSAKLNKAVVTISDLTWNEFINREMLKTDNLVEIQGKTTSAAEDGINRFWNNYNDIRLPNLYGYKNIPSIPKPKPNTVYGITVGEQVIYKIYYQDGGWYDISFLDSSQEIALAFVPVHGMINYWADLVKQTF